MRDKFLLDPNIIFLNHGFAGACPRFVLDAHRGWQERLEKNPPRFIRTELPHQLELTRQTLANYLHVPSRNLLFVPNVTFGMNLVAHSLNLAPNDEILTTNHEFPVCNHIWEAVSKKRGASLKKYTIPFPLTKGDETIAELWKSVTNRTKVVFVSHITYATALLLPIEILCQKAQERGVVTVIDGAHGPGLVSLDISSIKADFYVGACHKWLCAPKGSAFLYASDRGMELLEPLVIGWGQDSRKKHSLPRQYEELGTMDPSAYLATRAAIEFQEINDWSMERQRCRDLTQHTFRQLASVEGIAPHRTKPNRALQMGVIQLSKEISSRAQHYLYDIYRIEVPIIKWNGMDLLRLSVQAYNTEEDLDLFVSAFRDLCNN